MNQISCGNYKSLTAVLNNWRDHNKKQHTKYINTYLYFTRVMEIKLTSTFVRFEIWVISRVFKMINVGDVMCF